MLAVGARSVRRGCALACEPARNQAKPRQANLLFCWRLLLRSIDIICYLTVAIQMLRISYVRIACLSCSPVLLFFVYTRYAINNNGNIRYVVRVPLVSNLLLCCRAVLNRLHSFPQVYCRKELFLNPRAPPHPPPSSLLFL